jgi:hypothetical protein
MADDKKEEFPPLLAPGFYDIGIEGVRRLCVVRFPDSVTRRSIMAGLERVIEAIQVAGIRGEVWIDGSFLTEKLNPDDSDIILVLTKDELSKMDAKQLEFIRQFASSNLSTTHKCDNYVLVRDDTVFAEWNYAYWLRQFGFSRSDQMKGLAVVKLPFLVMP